MIFSAENQDGLHCHVSPFLLRSFLIKTSAGKWLFHWWAPSIQLFFVMFSNRGTWTIPKALDDCCFNFVAWCFSAMKWVNELHFISRFFNRALVFWKIFCTPPFEVEVRHRGSRDLGIRCRCQWDRFLEIRCFPQQKRTENTTCAKGEKGWGFFGGIWSLFRKKDVVCWIRKHDLPCKKQLTCQ